MDAEGPVESPRHIPIQSLSDFVAEIVKLRHIGSELPPLFWFRGHDTANWPLSPGVLRPDVREQVRRVTGTPEEDTDQEAVAQEAAEKSVNEEFRRRAAALLPPTADPVDIYLLAQHHGLPTRLLDWTANPLAALFFAIAEHSEEDGEVVAVVVDWRLSFGDDLFARAGEHLPWPPVTQRHELVVKTVRFLFDEGARPPESLVVPFRPDLRFGRLTQQDACFTLHMPGCAAIHELSSNSQRFLVPASAKGQLLAELESIGVNWASLFPDLDHLTRQMKSNWGFG